MAVVIRMKRTGKKKAPFYVIVAADSRSPRDGRNLERIGTYDPSAEKGGVILDDSKLQKWLEKGAHMSDTVRTIIKGKRTAV